MFTLIEKGTGADKYGCKSTDVKLIEGIKNNSELIEIDTGREYYFDFETKTWLLKSNGSTPGPTGPTVGKYFTYTQQTESSIWPIQHNLGKKLPNIVCVDDTGERIMGDVEYTDENSLTIRYSRAVSGSAYIS